MKLTTTKYNGIRGLLFALSLMLITITIATISTTLMAYAEDIDDDGIRIFEDVIKAGNDDGNQAIADADCGPVSGFALGDVNQDCDALAANRDITQQETTSGEEPPAPQTCEECFRALLTPDEIQSVIAQREEGDTLEQLCDWLQSTPRDLTDFRAGLQSAGLGFFQINELVACLEAVGVQFS